jgi:hypothetical protein
MNIWKLKQPVHKLTLQSQSQLKEAMNNLWTNLVVLASLFLNLGGEILLRGLDL